MLVSVFQDQASPLVSTWVKVLMFLHLPGFQKTVRMLNEATCTSVFLSELLISHSKVFIRCLSPQDVHIGGPCSSYRGLKT